jgi:hypothetical protein
VIVVVEFLFAVHASRIARTAPARQLAGCYTHAGRPLV